MQRAREDTEIRGIRAQLRLSQFAVLLGVATETYRTWDSGRRAMPDGSVEKARVLALTHDPDRRMSLQELSTALGIHVRTLRDAARSGRL
jgi:hypothetical protein